MSSHTECPGCGKVLKRLTSTPERYRKHNDCDFSQTVIQEEECQVTPATSQTASSAQPPSDDAPESATPATPSTESSPSGPDEADSASIPGVEEYTEALATSVDALKARAESFYSESGRTLTPFTQPTPPDYERPTLFSQPLPRDWCPCMEVHGKIVCQGTCQSGPTVVVGPSAPAINFAQPAGRKSELPAEPMSSDAASIAARLKELFYAYDNRRSADNRSAQKTMGPSEMGTPCDRRLALSLMRMPPVNPGGDGWAAFVGTAIHSALEQMFMWADAGTGRFAVEQRLEFGHPIVPKGTADLLDRVLLMVLDHKCQGRWSRNKLKTSGLSPTYQVQAHVYAHGMRLKGEKIEKVAIISWPRDEATLDDLYVHVEDYNPAIVKKAFERVDRIAAQVETSLAEAKVDVKDEMISKALVAGDFDVTEDCRFCPFFLPNSKSIKDGCNGKR